MPIRKATVEDVKDIQKLVNYYAKREKMLPRSLNELYESIRNFFVYVEGKKIYGCCALNIDWEDLAEIKSLAVAEGSRSLGNGVKLVKACLKEAEELGTPTVFCLTYKPAFFEGVGFSQVDKMELPQKVWGECYRCPKFPDCDEVALIYHLEA